METADICGLHLNVLIYDPKLHRFKENYTSKAMKLEALPELARDQTQSSKAKKKSRALKFQSIDARTCYQDDNGYDLPTPFLNKLHSFVCRTTADSSCHQDDQSETNDATVEDSKCETTLKEMSKLVFMPQAQGSLEDAMDYA